MIVDSFPETSQTIEKNYDIILVDKYIRNNIYLNL